VLFEPTRNGIEESRAAADRPAVDAEDMNTAILISPTTMRRPRRGKEGVESAIRAIEALQLDPLNVVGRSRDLLLGSRALTTRPASRWRCSMTSVASSTAVR
jgi:hypothetical protein